MRERQPYNPQTASRVPIVNTCPSSQIIVFFQYPNMSHPINSSSADTQTVEFRRLSQLQNSIRYLAKDHTLKDVMRLMEERHGYKAT